VCRSLDYRDKRLRSSVLIREGDFSLVIDTGPDFRQQMLRENVNRLHAVVFTHGHKDHIAGLDDVRAFNWLMKIEVPVYCTPEVHEQLRREFTYVFSRVYYPGIPRIQVHEIGVQPFTIGPFRIVPLPVLHMKLPVLGFRIGDFAYITDANFISEETVQLLSGVKIQVLNALQRDPHVSHFTLDEARREAARIGAPQTYFTHISHRMGLHGDTDKELGNGVALAYDGLTLEC
jgi:phosphoribosyl 1,2-cyclic phosphate phosphodiesterase